LLLAKLLKWTGGGLNEWREKRGHASEESSKKSEVATATEDGSIAESKPEILPPEPVAEEKGKEKKKDTPQPPAKLTPQQKISRQFFTALLQGTVVKDRSSFDSLEALRSYRGMMLSSGCVLVAASFYPGDGLRIYECIAGIVLVIAAILQSEQAEELHVEILGSAVGQVIASHTIEDNIEILKMVSKVLPVISQHINPTPGEKEPMQIVAEIAEKSGSNANIKPNRTVKKKRRNR
jgi:hypothetical protein